MKHTLHNINGFNVIAFDECMTNKIGGKAEASAKWANKNKVGGFDDWVMPKREVLFALQSLSDGMLGSIWVWSSSPDDSGLAWVVDFDDGYVSYDYRNYVSAVRLVRASQCLDIGHAAVDRWKL